MICYHELWGGPQGFCTGLCGDRPPPLNVLPYMEVLDPEASPLPGIALDEESDQVCHGRKAKTVVGPCLDYESSAYDSMDSDQEFQEEYDANDSFIDDSESTSEDDGSEDEDGSNEDEPDYKAMYRRLKETHNELIDDYVGIDNAFRTFRREIGIDDSDSDGMDDDDELEDEEVDEDGMFIVEVKNPDPVTTEIIVSHALEESQESQINDERIRARARAFEAAQRPSG